MNDAAPAAHDKMVGLVETMRLTAYGLGRSSFVGRGGPCQTARTLFGALGRKPMADDALGMSSVH